MKQKKHPLKSKTIWSSILLLVVGILSASGVVTGSQAEIIQSIGPEVLVGVTTSILSLVAAYGRITAKTTLGKAQ